MFCDLDSCFFCHYIIDALNAFAFCNCTHKMPHCYLQVYSNRAACYTKLGAMPEGLKDAEKCLELDPNFTKGYTRKGAIQFFMKEYDKAMETYQAGLKLDPNNQELLDGVRR